MSRAGSAHRRVAMSGIAAFGAAAVILAVGAHGASAEMHGRGGGHFRGGGHGYGGYRRGGYNGGGYYGGGYAGGGYWGGGGYYNYAPPVVYGGYYDPGYYYDAPPVVYGPGIGVNIGTPGFSLGIGIP